MAESAKEKAPDGIPLPRWLLLMLSVTLWPSLYGFFQGFLPWLLSRHATRLGWTEHHPAWWNWTGTLLVVCGATIVLWFWWVHVRQVASQKQLQLKATPDYLLTCGPYRFSRNPAYVGVIIIWLGWTIFYGSWLVGAGSVAWWVLMPFVTIPREERGLAAKFGGTYLAYKVAVPRWWVRLISRHWCCI